MERIGVSTTEKNRLQGLLSNLSSPYEDLEDFLLTIYPIFGGISKDILIKIRAFRTEPIASGFMLLEGLPSDGQIPQTPTEGLRSEEKRTFISEACLLGVAQILGEPLGYRDERSGEVVQNMFPIGTAARDTSSESSEVSLGFHTDFSFDNENPEAPFNVYNADFILLFCLRQDRNAEAYTMYIDARDICNRLTPRQVSLLREPIFQFAASFSFTGKCVAERIWSKPESIVTGPERYPEISVDLLCGTRGVHKEAEEALDVLRDVCSQPDLASRICLKPGNLLLINNRKGVHARTAFRAQYDGNDRWLQRVYVRQNLWPLRKASSGPPRVF